MADEGINFKNLENELSKALEADAKYQRENDAKFRAVSQKVANYDEFRDIVLASHLKPLNREDKIGGMPYQQWNAVSGSTNNTDGPTSEPTKKKLSKPKTEAEFKRDWLKARIGKDRYEYIVHITGPQDLPKVLKIECDIAEFTKVLNDNYQEEDVETIIEILEVVTKTKRFVLSLDFLDKNEIDVIKELFQKLKNSQTNIEHLEKVFKFT